MCHFLHHQRRRWCFWLNDTTDEDSLQDQQLFPFEIKKTATTHLHNLRINNKDTLEILKYCLQVCVYIYVYILVDFTRVRIEVTEI